MAASQISFGVEARIHPSDRWWLWLLKKAEDGEEKLEAVHEANSKDGEDDDGMALEYAPQKRPNSDWERRGADPAT
ncbi:hypothetical protein F2Q69_00003899 [Brassica cretica]|uniref:Uncharacterized protein n=1 Tax=Brassica cretica TaxID=69181 RepID=A0A8S9NYM6_BRACR|nr:hypothetical protein F2Q69_00003899 [Brassica cretica]